MAYASFATDKSRTGELVNTIHCNFSNYRKEKNKAHPFSKHLVYYQNDETFITNRKAYVVVR